VMNKLYPPFLFVKCLHQFKSSHATLRKHTCWLNSSYAVSLSYPPSFIRLVDYLIVNTLHSLMVNAVHKLLTVFQEQVGQMPCHAIIQSWSHHSETASEKEIDKKVGQCFCISQSQAIYHLQQIKLQSRHVYVFSLFFACLCIFFSVSSQRLLVSILYSCLN